MHDLNDQTVPVTSSLYQLGGSLSFYEIGGTTSLDSVLLSRTHPVLMKVSGVLPTEYSSVEEVRLFLSGQMDLLFSASFSLCVQPCDSLGNPVGTDVVEIPGQPSQSSVPYPLTMETSLMPFELSQFDGVHYYKLSTAAFNVQFMIIRASCSLLVTGLDAESGATEGIGAKCPCIHSLSVGKASCSAELPNGRMCASIPLFHLGNDFISLDVSLNYYGRLSSSTRVGSSSMLGDLWRLSVEGTLSTDDGRYIYVDGLGYRHVFSEVENFDPTFPTYIDSSGTGLILLDPEGTPIIASPDGTEIFFDSTGRLREVWYGGSPDTMGYEVEYGAGGRISSIALLGSPVVIGVTRTSTTMTLSCPGYGTAVVHYSYDGRVSYCTVPEGETYSVTYVQLGRMLDVRYYALSKIATAASSVSVLYDSDRRCSTLVKSEEAPTTVEIERREFHYGFYPTVTTTSHGDPDSELNQVYWLDSEGNVTLCFDPEVGVLGGGEPLLFEDEFGRSYVEVPNHCIIHISKILDSGFPWPGESDLYLLIKVGLTMEGERTFPISVDSALDPSVHLLTKQISLRGPRPYGPYMVIRVPNSANVQGAKATYVQLAGVSVSFTAFFLPQPPKREYLGDNNSSGSLLWNGDSIRFSPISQIAFRFGAGPVESIECDAESYASSLLQQRHYTWYAVYFDRLKKAYIGFVEPSLSCDGVFRPMGEVPTITETLSYSDHFYWPDQPNVETPRSTLLFAERNRFERVNQSVYRVNKRLLVFQREGGFQIVNGECTDYDWSMRPLVRSDQSSRTFEYSYDGDGRPVSSWIEAGMGYNLRVRIFGPELSYREGEGAWGDVKTQSSLSITPSAIRTDAWSYDQSSRVSSHSIALSGDASEVYSYSGINVSSAAKSTVSEGTQYLHGRVSQYLLNSNVIRQFTYGPGAAVSFSDGNEMPISSISLISELGITSTVHSLPSGDVILRRDKRARLLDVKYAVGGIQETIMEFNYGTSPAQREPLSVIDGSKTLTFSRTHGKVYRQKESTIGETDRYLHHFYTSSYIGSTGLLESRVKSVRNTSIIYSSDADAELVEERVVWQGQENGRFAEGTRVNVSGVGLPSISFETIDDPFGRIGGTLIRSSMSELYRTRYGFGRSSAPGTSGAYEEYSLPLTESFYLNGSDTAAQTNVYAYDAAGRIVSVSSSLSGSFGSAIYTRDTIGRITSETIDMGSASLSYSYSYDNANNLVSLTRNGSTVYFTVDTQCRIVSDSEYGAPGYAYDAAGFPTKYRGLNVSWKCGRLETFGAVSFLYDGTRLVGIEANSDQTNALTYLFERLEYETVTYYEGSVAVSQRTFRYVYGANGKIAGFLHLGSFYAFQRNLFGDIVAIWMDGSVVCRYLYSAFGERRAYDSSGFPVTDGSSIALMNPFGYRGARHVVNVSIIMMGARLLDPITGRFISPDEEEYLHVDGKGGVNPYLYCFNDPITYLDESGHFAISSYFIGLGIAVGIGALVGGTAYTISASLSSAIDGEWSWSWGGFVGSVLGGALGGALSFILPSNWALFVSGFTGFSSTAFGMMLQNQWEETNYSDSEILISSVLSGFLATGMSAASNAIHIRGLNSGRNSYAAISKQIVTKFHNGTISRISYNTFSKMLTLDLTMGMMDSVLNGVLSAYNVNEWLVKRMMWRAK